MSASVKLKTLDTAMTESYNRTLAKAEPPYFSSREITILRAALPQIVAVVKAAEDAESWLNTESVRAHGDVPVLTVALADLDKALKKLQAETRGSVR
jgi:hypothetical protein